MAALCAGAALSFRRTLERHLDAIQRRDLAALAETVAADALLLRGSDPRDRRPWDGVRQESLLTLVFEKRGDKWLMVLDQNTPSK